MYYRAKKWLIWNHYTTDAFVFWIWKAFDWLVKNITLSVFDIMALHRMMLDMLE
jgi:hypothetical protein